MKMIITGVVTLLLVSCSPRPTVNSSALGPVSSVCTFSEKSGESFNQAILIGGVQTQRDGMAAEYHYISGKFGTRGKDWFLLRQTILSDANRIIDVVEIQLQDPAERKLIYFDAGNFIR